MRHDFPLTGRLTVTTHADSFRNSPCTEVQYGQVLWSLTTRDGVHRVILCRPTGSVPLVGLHRFPHPIVREIGGPPVLGASNRGLRRRVPTPLRWANACLPVLSVEEQPLRRRRSGRFVHGRRTLQRRRGKSKLQSAWTIAGMPRTNEIGCPSAALSGPRSTIAHALDSIAIPPTRNAAMRQSWLGISTPEASTPRVARTGSNKCGCQWAKSTSTTLSPAHVSQHANVATVSKSTGTIG